MLNPAPTSLEKKIGIVTGANGNIGATAVQHFTELGTNILATDMGNSFEGNRIANYSQLNLDPDNDLNADTKWITDEQPAILNNSAATFGMRNVVNADFSQYDDLILINVCEICSVLWSCSQILINARKMGSLVNLSSKERQSGEPSIAYYCATGVTSVGYKQSAALVLVLQRIQVNDAISPSVVNTPIWIDIKAVFVKFRNKKIKQKKRDVTAFVLQGYRGHPTKLAYVDVFPASNQSQDITAQTLNVNSG